MHSKINNKPTHLQNFNYTSFYHDDSYYSAFSNFFNNFVLINDGKLDYYLLGKIGVSSVLEIVESLGISYASRNQVRFIKVYTAIWAITVIKDLFYSNIVTHHMTPNAINNFNDVWYEINSEKNITSEDRANLAKYNSEASIACYQSGLVLKGVLSGVTKFGVSIYLLVEWSKKDAALVISYNVVMCLISYFLNQKVSEKFQEIKTLDSEKNSIPFLGGDQQEIYIKLTEISKKINSLEDEMQILKIFLFITNTGHDILSNKKGLWELIREHHPVEREREYTTQFSESTFVVQWIKDNAFRFIDMLHRVDASNKEILKLFSLKKNDDGVQVEGDDLIKNTNIEQSSHNHFTKTQDIQEQLVTNEEVNDYDSFVKNLMENNLIGEAKAEHSDEL